MTLQEAREAFEQGREMRHNLEEVENKYRQALFMHRQYPYDQFKEGYYEGMQRLLDLLGIDYSDW